MHRMRHDTACVVTRRATGYHPSDSTGLASRCCHGREARHARCVGIHTFAIQGHNAGCGREAKADQKEPGEALKAKSFPSIKRCANGQIAHDGPASLDEIAAKPSVVVR